VDQGVIASMKHHYWADHPRALADEDDSWQHSGEKWPYCVLYVVCLVWCTVRPLIVVWSWKKLRQFIDDDDDDDDDCLGFPNEEVSMSEMTDLVSVYWKV
jgi:hypothetical protein